MELLADKNTPLVLAGVDYLVPIYQEANDYPHLIGDALEGNPEQFSPEELHRDTWKIVKPYFSEDRQDSINRYLSLTGNNDELASSDVEEIVAASHHGQVDVLFVASQQQVWGTFDPEDYSVKIHDEYSPGDQDLLDLAAIQTLMTDGKVYEITDGEMPEGEIIASIFRYVYEGESESS
jgi:hypothetical protein